MPNQLLIGVGAGVAAALMLASTSLGASALGLFLSLISITPIFLAGLGWGLLTGVVAALTAALALILIASPSAGGVWLLTQAAPALILIRYAFLNRPGTNNQPGTGTMPPQSRQAQAGQAQAGQARTHQSQTGQAPLEWYPIGQLVMIAGFIGSIMAMLTMALIGSSSDVIRAKIKEAVPLYAKQFPQLKLEKLDDAAISTLAEVAMFLLPVATAMAVTAILLFNFWLAARITHGSGRLFRPWPDIGTLSVPNILSLALTVALGGTLLSGIPAIIAASFAGGLIAIYLCVGLAIIHYVTRGNSYRSFILAGVYFALIYLNSFAMIIIAMIGMSEPFSPLRRNFTQGAPPRDDNNTPT